MGINTEILASLLIPALALAVFVPSILKINRLKRQPKDPTIDRSSKPAWLENAVHSIAAIVFCAYALGILYFNTLLLRTGAQLPSGAQNSPIEMKGRTLYVTSQQAYWHAMSEWSHWILFGTVLIYIYLARRNNDA